MTTIIKTKKIAVIDTGRRLYLPPEVDDRIKQNWNELLKDRPWLFNGPVFSTVQMENNDGDITLKCEHSDYANYQLEQTVDLMEYGCKNTYAGCLLVSTDNEIFVSLNGTGSENEGKIQFIGGVIDPEDRYESDLQSAEDSKDSQVAEDSKDLQVAAASRGELPEVRLDPIVTAMRELGEETGTAIRDSIVSTGATYLITDGTKYGIQTIFRSSMSSKEILAAFDAFKNASDNTEIASIISFGKENIDEIKKFENRHDIGVIDLVADVIKELNNL